MNNVSVFRPRVAANYRAFPVPLSSSAAYRAGVGRISFTPPQVGLDVDLQKGCAGSSVISCPRRFTRLMLQSTLLTIRYAAMSELAPDAAAKPLKHPKYEIFALVGLFGADFYETVETPRSTAERPLKQFAFP